MLKLNINGKRYVRLDELDYALRTLKKCCDHATSLENETTKEAYNDVIRWIYREEYKAAKTDEEKEAILSLPGSFILYRKYGEKFEYFSEFADGHNPLFTFHADDATVFTYEEGAEGVASQLGPEWNVLDLNPVAAEEAKRLLDAIFNNTEEEEEA